MAISRLSESEEFLTRVNSLVGAEADSSMLGTIIEMTEDQMLSRLRVYLGDIEYIPDELEWVALEIVVARYNRVGAEGLKTEKVDGYSATYTDSILANYQTEFDRWARLRGYTGSDGAITVRFL